MSRRSKYGICALLVLCRPPVLGLRCPEALGGGMQEQYLELSTALQPDGALYGLGERTSSAGLRVRRDGQPLALWARDCGSAYPDVNLYSSWPYWLEVRPGARPRLPPSCMPRRPASTPQAASHCSAGRDAPPQWPRLCAAFTSCLLSNFVCISATVRTGVMAGRVMSWN